MLIPIGPFLHDLVIFLLFCKLVLDYLAIFFFKIGSEVIKIEFKFMLGIDVKQFRY